MRFLRYAIATVGMEKRDPSYRQDDNVVRHYKEEQRSNLM